MGGPGNAAGSDRQPPEQTLGHGVPSEAGEAEPMGLPTSDRHHSETAPAENGGAADAPKHDHATPSPDTRPHGE